MILPRHEWTARFTAELRTLNPFLSMVSASTQAVVAHEAGPDVIPEEAARIWVNTPVSAFGEFGAPRRGVKARPDALKQQAWVVRFAIHLHKLQTSDGADATRVAMKIMQEARDLQPEEATAIYAAEIPPPDDPGTPGD